MLIVRSQETGRSRGPLALFTCEVCKPAERNVALLHHSADCCAPPTLICQYIDIGKTEAPWAHGPHPTFLGSWGPLGLNGGQLVLGWVIVPPHQGLIYPMRCSSSRSLTWKIVSIQKLLTQLIMRSQSKAQRHNRVLSVKEAVPILVSR